MEFLINLYSLNSSCAAGVFFVCSLYSLPVLVFLFMHPSNADSITTPHVMPNIAMNQHRICAIVCQTPPADGGRVLLRTFDSTNAPLSPVVVVNSSYKGIGQNADVIIDREGIVTVAWEQFMQSRIQIGIARFDFSGKMHGSPIFIKSDHSLADQLPRIALGKDGKFVVVWNALGKGIVGHRFSNNGKKYGTLFQISQKKLKNPQYPSVRIDKKNRIGVVWQEGSNDDFCIVMRVLDWRLRKSRIFHVDDAKGLAYFSNPEIGFLGNGGLVVTWKDYRSDEANIFQQIYDETLKPISKNIRVNDDTGRQWQRLPRMASTGGPGYVIVWEDYRNDSNNQVGDIYFQKYAEQGKRLGNNIRVEVPSEPTPQRFPAAAMEPHGELIIAWSDSRWNNSAIYLERFTSEGKPKSSEVQIFH
jgi:hypothetical protein